MRIHEPFTVFPRRMSSGRTVWYFRAYDEDRKRPATARSTGQETKSGARAYCRRLQALGRLLAPDLPREAPAGDIAFGDWCRGFWDWDGSYVRARLEFSDPAKPGISARHATDMGRILELYILPTFQRTRLNRFTPLDIETWALKLREGGLSGKRVNNIVSCLRTMLTEAHRAGLLGFDVTRKRVIRALGSAPTRRGRLTMEEVKLLFSEENIAGAWENHTLYRCVSYVAAATGCRQGEVLALRDEDVRGAWLQIRHSWHARYGLGPTKTRHERVVPLPPRVHDAMQPFLGSGGFVFSLSGGARPVSGNRCTSSLYAALEKIGIPPAERRERGIVFHGWRRWLNSTLRADGVPDDLIRRVVGHETEGMTDTYTTYDAADFAPVAAVQGKVFG